MQYVVKMGMRPNLVNCKNGKQHLVVENETFSQHTAIPASPGYMPK